MAVVRLLHTLLDVEEHVAKVRWDNKKAQALVQKLGLTILLPGMGQHGHETWQGSAASTAAYLPAAPNDGPRVAIGAVARR